MELYGGAGADLGSALLRPVLGIAAGEGIASASELARLDELLPRSLDDPREPLEEVYARIVDTARVAGEEVPSYARIPWQ